MDAITPLAEQQLDTEPKATCEHCGNPFEPRKGSGGKPQRFCNAECRQAFHANAQHSQRSPTYDTARPLPAGLQPAARPEPEPYFWAAQEVADCLVVPSQPATAVYWNDRGDIVIRQERRDYDDDSFVFVTPANARALAAALIREAESWERDRN